MDRTFSGLWIIIFMTAFVLGCSQNPKEQKQNSAPNLLATEDSAVEYQKAALANVELGLGYLAQGQVTRAKGKLTRALKLAPRTAETHSAMAFFLEKVGDIKDAEKAHQKAIKYSKSPGSVYNNYGAFLCRQSRFKEADDAFQTSIADKTYSRTAEVFENAGVCALKWQDNAKAEKYFLTAIRHDPKRSTALLELASLDIQNKNFDAAKQMLTQYKQVSEPSARSLWLNIELARNMNNENAVASHALLLKNLFEDSPEYKEYMKIEMGPQ